MILLIIMLILVVISATVLYKRFLKPCFSIQSEDFSVPVHSETVPERIIEKEPQNVIYVINPKFCRDVSDSDSEVSEEEDENENITEIQKETEKVEIVQKDENEIEDRIVEKVLKRLKSEEKTEN